jgi:hypothetical protein
VVELSSRIRVDAMGCSEGVKIWIGSGEGNGRKRAGRSRLCMDPGVQVEVAVTRGEVSFHESSTNLIRKKKDMGSGTKCDPRPSFLEIQTRQGFTACTWLDDDGNALPCSRRSLEMNSVTHICKQWCTRALN